MTRTDAEPPGEAAVRREPEQRNWAWEIYKHADNLIHARTHFTFSAQAFLVTAYVLLVVNWQAHDTARYRWTLIIVTSVGLLFSIYLGMMNRINAHRIREFGKKHLRDVDATYSDYFTSEPVIPHYIVFGYFIPGTLAFLWLVLLIFAAYGRF